MTKREQALLNTNVREAINGDIEIKCSETSWWLCCPSYINMEWEDVDDDSMKLDDKFEYTIGCRGITCKECWNKEI